MSVEAIGIARSLVTDHEHLCDAHTRTPTDRCSIFQIPGRMMLTGWADRDDFRDWWLIVA
jgi:hypothetical protein